MKTRSQYCVHVNGEFVSPFQNPEKAALHLVEALRSALLNTRVELVNQDRAVVATWTRSQGGSWQLQGRKPVRSPAWACLPQWVQDIPGPLPTERHCACGASTKRFFLGAIMCKRCQREATRCGNKVF